MATAIQVKVDTRVLRSTASEVSGLARQLQADFDALQQCVKQTGRYWVGEAGDQYRREFDAEKADTSEILERLNKYPADLLSMAGIYEETEAENIQNSGALPSDIL